MRSLERIHNLHTEKVNNGFEKIDSGKVFALNMADPIYGYQSQGDMDAIIEFSNMASRFMNRWNIGKHLSPSKWSKSAQDDIKRALRSLFNPGDGTVKPDSLQLQDEIKSKVANKYSSSDIAVVARTETAKMKATVQLLQWQEAGVKRVRYRTKGDNKTRPSHAAMNNRIFTIKELLENEDIRIPIADSPFNCRCRYLPVI